MKQKELQEKAQTIMKQYKCRFVYATPDGNIFLPDKKSQADYHAKQTQQTLIKIEFSETEQKPIAIDGEITENGISETEQNSNVIDEEITEKGISETEQNPNEIDEEITENGISKKNNSKNKQK